MSANTNPNNNSIALSTGNLTRNPNLSAPKIDRSSINEVQAKFGEQWWTGTHPEKTVGFNKAQNYLAALPLINLEICTRQDVLDYFNNSWTLTEILFSSLKDESTYIRPPYHQLRHPLLFYYGHPAVLYLNKLRLAGLVDKPVDLYLEKVLETGVDEMSWDDMAKNEMEWPSVSDVKDYRKKIYDIIVGVIQNHPDLDLAIRKKSKIKLNLDHPLWSLFMGFEHEKIHFETSSVLMRELPIELVETPKYWAPISSVNKSSSNKNNDVSNQWINIKGEKISYGKTKDIPSYGWDNEYGFRKNETSDFQITQKLISNKEYYEFIATGAYQQDKYWQSEGQMWRKFRNTKRPTFWVAYGPEGLHDYKLRTIFEIIDMPWDWPAEVNFHEAQAYCRWQQEKDQSQLHYRLITEAEHVTLRKNLAADDVLQKTSYSLIEKQKYQFNFNFQHSSASAVDLHSTLVTDKNSQPQKVYDLFGNVWQWAEDQFNPLNEFQIHKLYDDFSTPCFDGKHQMILGGSFISCGHEASQYARFHFRPHFFQHAGFRIAATLNGSTDNSAIKLKKDDNYVHPQRSHVLDQTKNENWWKNIQQPLEMSTAEINHAYQVTSQFVTKFENNRKTAVSAMGTALDPNTNDIKDHFTLAYQTSKNFPENPENFDKLIQFISSEVLESGQQPGHPNYMAYVAGAANPLSAPAQAIALTMNQFTGHYGLSPGLVTLEMEVIKWFITMMKYPEINSTGILTSGGSQANMIALVAARNKLFNAANLSQARFYASSQAHHCIGKALAFLGFPKESLHIVDVDQNLKMSVNTLEKTIQSDLKNKLVPVAIIGTAGSTNTGTIDPLNEIADIAEKYNVWFHVDGAYGAPFMLTEKGQKVLAGIERSDSVALDPHKALQIPYGVGALLVKNKNDLSIQYAGSSSYMPPSQGLSEDNFHKIDFADVSPELSRDPRGLRLWLPFKTFGIGPFKLNLEEKIKLSEWVSTELKKMKDIIIVAEPNLTIQSFRLSTDQKTHDLLKWINSQNKIFLSGCEINGQFSIRVCLLGYKLHYQQAEELIQLIHDGIKQIK